MASETTPLNNSERKKRSNVIIPGGGGGEDVEDDEEKQQDDHDDQQDDDKDRPFTCNEKIKLFIFFLLFPWILTPLFLFGAYIRTFPKVPTLWIGYWMLEISFTIGYMVAFVLLVNYPRILRERSRSVPTTENGGNYYVAIEKTYFLHSTIVSFVCLTILSYDSIGRYDTYPIQLNILGSIIIIVCFLWIVYVFRTNQYASRFIYKQDGHQLIQSGPYSIVRHPMYMGSIPFALFGVPLCIGSYWGMIPMLYFAITVCKRTYLEEDFLCETFGNDYITYRENVPYKIIPYIF